MARKDNPITTTDSLAAVLRQARQARRMTLSELADKLGYHISYLSTVENGRKHPARQLVMLYAAFLGADEAQLLAAWERAEARLGRTASAPPAQEMPGMVSKPRTRQSGKQNPHAAPVVPPPELAYTTHVPPTSVRQSSILAIDPFEQPLQFPENDIIGAFLDIAEHDPEPDVRQEAILAVGQLSTPATIPGLRRCLTDPEGVVRRAAIQAITAILVKYRDQSAPPVARALGAAASRDDLVSNQSIVNQHVLTDEALAQLAAALQARRPDDAAELLHTVLREG